MANPAANISKTPNNDNAPIILGIESSCDETAAALVTHHSDGSIKILSSIIASQDDAHAPYGGVVPEIAARAHMQKIDGIIKRSVEDADVAYDDISAVAATAGPGSVSYTHLTLPTICSV